MALKPTAATRRLRSFTTARRRALARLRKGLDLQWTPPNSRDALHERGRGRDAAAKTFDLPADRVGGNGQTSATIALGADLIARLKYSRGTSEDTAYWRVRPPSAWSKPPTEMTRRSA